MRKWHGSGHEEHGCDAWVRACAASRGTKAYPAPDLHARTALGYSGTRVPKLTPDPRSGHACNRPKEKGSVAFPSQSVLGIRVHWFDFAVSRLTAFFFADTRVPGTFVP
eukprot:2092251-Rhodomonas_salina.1